MTSLTAWVSSKILEWETLGDTYQAHFNYRRRPIYRINVLL